MDCIDHGKLLGRVRHAIVWSKELKRTTSAHRIVYCEHNNLPLKSIAGKVIRHTCDNPRCINPAHLLIGTHKDNIADMWERGRQVIIYGADHTMAKLTWEQVQFIRDNYVAKDKELGCRALARRFGVAHPQISRVVNKRGYIGQATTSCSTG